MKANFRAVALGFGLAAVALTWCSTTSHAATLKFEVTNADWTDVIDDDYVVQDTSGNDVARLGWGANGSFSRFKFDGKDTFAPIPMATAFEIGSLLHTNNPIRLGTAIGSATLLLAATLTFVDGLTTSIVPGVSLAFLFDHTETPNVGWGCCSDLVSVQLIEALGLDGAPFIFNLLGFQVGGGAFFDTLSTPENQKRTAKLMASWSLRPEAPPPPEVPLPPAALLFISALAGIGWLGRRRLRVCCRCQ